MTKVVGVVLLAAATAAPTYANVNGGRRTCGIVSVTSPDRPRVRGSFSATKTLDLQFRMLLTNKDDDGHVVTFRVTTPKGRLYQEIQVPHRDAAGKRVSAILGRLPLTGTPISTSSLYGRWRVAPYVDGSLRPCAAASVFSIVK